MGKFRGGCLCADEVAATYDANVAEDTAMAKKLLPPDTQVWVADGMLMFEMQDKTGESWFGQITRRDPQWFTKRKPTSPKKP